VDVRISVPRWLHKQPVNFPLVPLSSVEDLMPHKLSVAVASALGLGVSAFGDDAEQLVPIRRWAVRRVSYAADLVMRDPRLSVMGCLSLDRRHGGKFSAFGNPISTAQWQSDALRVQLYAKSLEIKSHKADGESERNALELLAERAKHVLRYEVTFRKARAIRDLLGINAKMPTLAFMCDPLISAWVLTREAVRLRLDDDYEGLKTTTFPGRVRDVGATLREAQTRMAAGEELLPRRQSLTPKRVWDLAAAHFLLSAYTLDETAAMSGKSLSALREMEADLRSLGAPPDGTLVGSQRDAIAEFTDKLEPHTIKQYPPDLSHWRNADAFVIPPWSDAPSQHEDCAATPSVPVDEEWSNELRWAIEDV
jgi:hypothetical protein